MKSQMYQQAIQIQMQPKCWGKPKEMYNFFSFFTWAVKIEEPIKMSQSSNNCTAKNENLAINL